MKLKILLLVQLSLILLLPITTTTATASSNRGTDVSFDLLGICNISSSDSELLCYLILLEI